MAQISTEYVYPPIPIRNFDWRAWFTDNDEEGPVGWGATQEQAIADLQENAE
jgi:hypothetical protein